MPVLNFNDLCTSLCELMGVPPPALVPDAHGVVGFTVTCRSTEIGFVDDQRGSEPAILMVAPLGAPPAGTELQAMHALLEANHGMLGAGTPVFTRDPANGHLWLCQGFRPAQLQVQAVFQAMAQAVDRVEAWHTHHFLQTPAAPAQPPWPMHLMNLA